MRVTSFETKNLRREVGACDDACSKEYQRVGEIAKGSSGWWLSQEVKADSEKVPTRMASDATEATGGERRGGRGGDGRRQGSRT